MPFRVYILTFPTLSGTGHYAELTARHISELSKRNRILYTGADLTSRIVLIYRTVVSEDLETRQNKFIERLGTKNKVKKTILIGETKGII